MKLFFGSIAIALSWPSWPRQLALLFVPCRVVQGSRKIGQLHGSPSGTPLPSESLLGSSIQRSTCDRRPCGGPPTSSAVDSVAGQGRTDANATFRLKRVDVIAMICVPTIPRRSPGIHCLIEIKGLCRCDRQKFTVGPAPGACVASRLHGRPCSPVDTDVVARAPSTRPDTPPAACSGPDLGLLELRGGCRSRPRAGRIRGPAKGFRTAAARARGLSFLPWAPDYPRGWPRFLTRRLVYGKERGPCRATAWRLSGRVGDASGLLLAGHSRDLASAGWAIVSSMAQRG
jgi:hypothetical protein